MTYFLDSNIVSYILNGKSAIKNRIEELLLQGNDIFIPTFVYYEIKRGLLAVGATSKLERFDNFVKTLGLINLTMQTYDMAANFYALLKKQGLLIEDADLFIGCSALENSAILITNNANHLKRVPGLKIEVLE